MKRALGSSLWDDHEFDNNCANDISEEATVEPAAFLERRANAYQAYYEMMPLRSTCLPSGYDMRLYRRASYGQLAELIMLDTRQYRSDQPNDDKRSPLNEAALNSASSMLGRKQKNWLCQRLLQSRATWNVLAQQVMMGLVKRAVIDDVGQYSMDQWPGYAAERIQLMRFMAERKNRQSGRAYGRHTLELGKRVANRRSTRKPATRRHGVRRDFIDQWRKWRRDARQPRIDLIGEPMRKIPQRRTRLHFV